METRDLQRHAAMRLARSTLLVLGRPLQFPMNSVYKVPQDKLIRANNMMITNDCQPSGRATRLSANDDNAQKQLSCTSASQTGGNP
ncbi:MAG: hypothetical protein A3J49_10325 [Gallionellales bacterium RIFCSPHIGHO2_02_FULL_57_16]|nr:MAG: hypothetical protein A3J49_10325 [Gallionellales bacterium RIFCSPHIGHO2_02_FULL_57_16]